MERGRKFFSEYFRRQKSVLDANKTKDLNTGLTMTTKASVHLRKLVGRHNPNLAEFPFLCLGRDDQINEIVTATERYSGNSGLRVGLSGSHAVTSVDNQELVDLFLKLYRSDRMRDLLVFGHLHPSGQTIIGGNRYIVSPSESLLTPSMGYKTAGGPTGDGDLAFLKSFSEQNPNFQIPYFGIAANTPGGPKFRIYRPEDLMKIKRPKDMDKIPQKTFTL